MSHKLLKYSLAPIGLVISYGMVKLGMNQAFHLYSIMGMWGFISIYYLKYLSHKLPKAIFSTLLIGLVTLSLCDLILASFGRGKGRAEYSSPLLMKDGELGATMLGSRTVRHRTWNGSTPLYDVKYTIDNGKRITATSRLKEYDGCIVFLGDSVTFGQGVRDEESFPYIVSKHFPSYKTINLSVPSSGPHQTLRQLQLSPIECSDRPVYIFYSFLFDHYRRVAGSTRWALYGPRYTLGSDDELELSGQLCDNFPGGCKGYDYTRFLGLFNIKTFATIYDLVSAKNFDHCKAQSVSSAIFKEMNIEIKKQNPSAVTTLNIFDMQRSPEMFCGKSALEELGSYGFDQVVDYDPKLFRGDAIFHPLVDRHPKKEQHLLIANRIIENLEALLGR